MFASVTLSDPNAYDLPEIFQQLGVDSSTTYPTLRDKVLTVPGVSQEDLEAVIAAFDTEAYQRKHLSAYAAELRWQKEVGGTTWNGWPVHTDRESQQKIASERLAVVTGDRTDGEPWKFKDDVFRSLANLEVEALATAVRTHVKDCFAQEGQALQGIADGTITTKADVEAVFA